LKFRTKDRENAKLELNQLKDRLSNNTHDYDDLLKVNSNLIEQLNVSNQMISDYKIEDKLKYDNESDYEFNNINSLSDELDEFKSQSNDVNHTHYTSSIIDENENLNFELDKL